MPPVDYNFREALSRLQTVVGLHTQVEMAKWLGISQPAFSHACSRKAMPAQWLLTALRKQRLNPDWVLRGDPHPRYLAAMPQEAPEAD